jgi:L-lactate dehydrogenase complex protein LldG
MAEPINLNVIVLKDPPSVTTAIADLIRNKDPEWGRQKNIVTWKHSLIESLNLPDALADQNVPVYVTELKEGDDDETFREKDRERVRKHVVDSYIGVTSADFCMAETASLVMRTRPGQARSVSLVPSIHIAVIHLDQIIADLKELYALIQWDTEGSSEGLTNCMTFISGPSKTADVEATMVHGAHGPREVYVYVIGI